MNKVNELRWKKTRVLNDKNSFICLVDAMGDDAGIVRAARTSFGNDHPDIESLKEKILLEEFNRRKDFSRHEGDRVTGNIDLDNLMSTITVWKGETKLYEGPVPYGIKIIDAVYNQATKDRKLIRHLMSHRHTSPFEMVEFIFLVQVPMDCWRQWVRHRTASINEHSTRYTEALDCFQVTGVTEWRLQSTDNKQGSFGKLTKWSDSVSVKTNGNTGGFDVVFHYGNSVHSYSLPYDWWSKMGYLENPNGKYDDYGSYIGCDKEPTPGQALTYLESQQNVATFDLYNLRLALGVAREQARKDLPLSTYTRAYWKCDLHNIFNFLRLRMVQDAQFEIRQYANAMYDIVKQICPVACEAFEDYVLHAKTFSRMEIEVLKTMIKHWNCMENQKNAFPPKPSSMTDREWKEFIAKLS